jgi:Flp pilus assembly protein TadD
VAQVSIVLLSVCVLAAGTAAQTAPWSSDLLLYYRGFIVAPNNKVVKNNLAIELSKRGLYREAIPMFQKTLETDPDNWIALSNIGYAYFKIGRLDEADRDLTRAIQIYWMSPSPYLSLGLVKQARGKLDEATQNIRQAISLRPNGDGFHEALGNVLRQQGDLTGALEEFRKEIESNPERSSAREQMDEVETILGPRARPVEGNPR